MFPSPAAACLGDVVLSVNSSAMTLDRLSVTHPSKAASDASSAFLDWMSSAFCLIGIHAFSVRNVVRLGVPYVAI